ncbi:DUF4259 domain-containing protein [Streptomyces sp. NPDC089919]|uniref:DUF4259 domain-containing protein n=1 Tax=Streptomyces sp. NPDC089919 TaxID=3155188 RepID=UPI00341FDB13
MGTWGVGAFENDTAADWCGALDDVPAGTRPGLVLEALARTVGTTGYLDADDAQEAVAAAALVAAQCPGGEAADSPYGPEGALPDLTGLRELAGRALDRVTAEPSELLELWEEAEGGPWRTSVDRLRRTLRP